MVSRRVSHTFRRHDAALMLLRRLMPYAADAAIRSRHVAAADFRHTAMPLLLPPCCVTDVVDTSSLSRCFTPSTTGCRHMR